jgi:hypothetical protein
MWDAQRSAPRQHATGLHSKEQGYFLAVCISHCWLSALTNIRWNCLASLSIWHTFSGLFFSPSGDLFFNKNFVLSFLLCPLPGRHLAKHMDAYYKGPAGSWCWGTSSSLNLDSHKKPNIWERYPPVTSLCSVCLLSITFQRLGTLFPWGPGRWRKSSRTNLQNAVHHRFQFKVEQHYPLPPRGLASWKACPKQHICNAAGYRQKGPLGSMFSHWLSSGATSTSVHFILAHGSNAFYSAQIFIIQKPLGAPWSLNQSVSLVSLNSSLKENLTIWSPVSILKSSLCCPVSNNKFQGRMGWGGATNQGVVSWLQE